MENSTRYIDSLLGADKSLTEGWVEYQLLKTSVVYSGLSTIMELKRKPTIIEVIKAVCSSGKTTAEKVTYLECVSCDLSLVAVEIGYMQASLYTPNKETNKGKDADSIN